MSRIYQKKYLDNGEVNPKFKPDTRTLDRHRIKNRHTTDNRVGDRHAERQFITLDGEGITREDGITHDYVILVASTGEQIINASGLTTEQCFQWLMELTHKYRKAIFCFFGGSYDFMQMLRDVPVGKPEDFYNGDRTSTNKLRLIWNSRDDNHFGSDATRVEVGHRSYTVSYIPRKTLTIRRINNTKPYNTELNKYNYDASIVLYDVLGFFGGRFVDVLADKKNGYFKEYLQEREEQEYLIFPDGYEVNMTSMKNMKNLRGSFTLEQLEEIASYTRDEVLCLSRLMNRLREYLKEADLKVTSWHGSGAVAGALLKRERVKDHLDDKQQLKDIPGLYDAQLRAYSGGNIQLLQFGSCYDHLFGYDVISSYPSAMPDLPSLTGGNWRRVTGMSNRKYALCHVRWNFQPDLPLYPFFYRTHDGSIFYPPQGENWIYKPEVDAALKAYREGRLSGTLEILESFEFEPFNQEKPLAIIASLFKTRQEWKKQERAAEKVLKLSYNSVYGRHAQGCGFRVEDKVIGQTDEGMDIIEKEIKKPQFHNLFWAGWITSCTRAKVFDAAIQSPENIIFIATDGIISRVPLNLDIGEALGQFELKESDGLVAVQSGVYWILHKVDGKKYLPEQANHYHNGVPYVAHSWYRGYDPGVLTIDFIQSGWKRWYELPVAASIFEKIKASELKVPSRRFVTLGSALSSQEMFKHFRTWREVERVIELFPSLTGKREQVPFDEKVNKIKPHEALIPTRARQPKEAVSQISSKYKIAWERFGGEFAGVDGVDALTVEKEFIDSEV